MAPDANVESDTRLTMCVISVRHRKLRREPVDALWTIKGGHSIPTEVLVGHGGRRELLSVVCGVTTTGAKQGRGLGEAQREGGRRQRGILCTASHLGRLAASPYKGTRAVLCTRHGPAIIGFDLK